MASITLKGNPVTTLGNLPATGTPAPEFMLTRSDMTDFNLASLRGKKVVMNIFPSLDTGICAASVRRFNQEAAKMTNTVVLCISRDLPYAHKRFCEAEGITNVVTASALRDDSFGKDYQLVMTDGKMASLLSRCIIILDENGIVKYTEQVPEIAQDPDFESALKAL